jgi:thioredoxin 2
MNADEATIRTCPHCGKQNRIPVEHLADVGRCGACKTPLPANGAPVEADETFFDTLVRRAKVPVLVDFWAAWCGPCRMMAPELEKLAASRAGQILVAKVNTDAHPELARRFSIEALPTLVLFRQGQPTQRLSGARTASAISRELAL